MIFWLIFISIPLIEIALFINVGGQVGIAWTLFLCVVTAAVGAFLVRKQGLETLFSARAMMERQELPVEALFDGFCLFIAGAVLVTPGFFTDMIGFSLLVPSIRRWLRQKAVVHFERHMAFSADVSSKPSPSRPEVIDVDFERLDTDENP